MRLRLTAGQAADIHQAIELVEGLAFDYLIADRGFAAQAFYNWVVEQEIQSVKPPHQAAKVDKIERPYDKWLYRERHLVECFVSKIRYFRRVFFRFDKLATRYTGFLLFASALIWLHSETRRH